MSFPVVLQGANRVFVKAESLEEYLVERARDPARKNQTYQFMKGQYNPGNRLDPSMDNISFEGIAYDLALQLRKQDFYPEPELGKSDLLIVVHYGATDDTYQPFRYDGLNDYDFDIFDELGNYRRPRGLEGLTNMELVHIRDRSYRSKLLGMDFDKTWAWDKRLLSRLSSEARYYVVLFAYDFQRLQQGDIRLLWRTRYSVRAIGQSFEVAIQDMNRIASDFMGKNIKGFVQKRVDDTSVVSFGDIEVIDVEEIKEEDRQTDFLNYDLPNVPPGIVRPRF